MNEGVRLYAGTQHGLIIWRSRQSGWQEIGRHFEDGIIDSIHGCKQSPERIFVGVTHNGLYCTADGGKSWAKVLDGDIRSVTVDPTDDKVIYSGIEPVGLFRLEHGGIVRRFDRGKSWEDVSKGIDYLDIHVISNLPKRKDRYYVASARGFFTSDKPEEGWVRAENDLTRDYFHDFLFLDSENDKPIMLVATADASPGFWRRENRGARAALFKSTDGAASWTRITDGLAEDLDSMIWALVHHPTDHRAVFAGFGNVARGHAHGAGGAGDLMISRDMGDSWERLDSDLPADRVLWVAAD